MSSQKNVYIWVFSLFFLFHVSAGFAQVINVDDAPYNATGDGVTDDRVAIQNAITNLRDNGGTLNFTSGKTYMISQGLNLNDFSVDHNYLVTSTGAGKATIKIMDGTSLTWGHWGFRLSQSRNITLKNLVIDGNRATRNPTEETSGTDVLFIDGASDGTRLYDLDLINSPMDNIYITVHTNQNQTKMTDFEMYNCKLENGFRNNMSIISGANFKIIGCQFIHANGTDPQAGIDFEPNDATPPYTNMTVEGCLFKNNVRYGIELTYKVAGSGNSTIKNNQFENNGISVAGPNNSIHHNVFRYQDHGIEYSDGSNRDGIIYFHANGEGKDNEVYNNYFYDNPMPAGYHLINFMSNSGGNNNVHDNFGFGNDVAGFVDNNTAAGTPPQILSNNTFQTVREIGFWNMDANQIAGTTMQDLSDFDHDGIIQSATSTEGVSNEALDFTPDGSHVAISANDALDIEMNITVMAWVYWHGSNYPAASSQTLVGRGNDWSFSITNGGKPSFHSNSPTYTGGGLISDIGVPTERWKLLTYTYDGRTLKIYLDEQEIASEPANGALGTSIAEIFLGKTTADDVSFNGLIDDARIYTYALTQPEIQAIFAASPLAVDWLTPLSALRQNENIKLTWSVAQQVNNEKFVMEHSPDGIDFQPIGQVAGDGNLAQAKTLYFLHRSPSVGANYYRIQQVDYDGKYTYSNVVFVHFESRSIDIYPNPAHDQLFFKQDLSLAQIRVFDLAGKLLLDATANGNSIDISQLSKGLYILKAVNNGQASQSLFLKE